MTIRMTISGLAGIGEKNFTLVYGIVTAYAVESDGDSSSDDRAFATFDSSEKLAQALHELAELELLGLQTRQEVVQ